jgi:CRISPR system Cascade subunit CasC
MTQDTTLNKSANLMTSPRFLQIHWLASYPASLLNRDDAGLAKRMPFGGKIRARISSQCLKRHWRLAGADDLNRAGDNPWALQNLEVPMGLRTKQIVETRIMPEARAQAPTADDIAAAVEKAFQEGLYGDKGAQKKSRQALFFGEPEIDFLTQHAAEALRSPDAKAATAAVERFFKEQRANLRALKDGAGLESALFGRMVTSDAAANRDASIHVAHALTVHEIEREMDFMTAVDDLKSIEDDAGAAGMFDMELASGLYYGYTVVDVELLVRNLSGDREIAAHVVEHLLYLVAQVSPGAKKGSTAPYSWAELILVEAGNRQPRTLANAFRNVVPLKTNRLLGETVERLTTYLSQIDTAYGGGEERRQLAPEASVSGIETLPLGTLAEWAAETVRAGSTA